MAEDRESVIKTYEDYFLAFQSLDPEVVVPYYHSPCLFVSPQGVLASTSATDTRALLAQMMKGLEARGYARSEHGPLGVKALSGYDALLSTRVVRYKSDDTEIEQFGATYTLRKSDTGWKIAVLVVHDSNTVLKLT